MTDPTASMTDRLVKFSDGISSSPFHCRAFSCSMMSAISGSISARDLLHASGQDTPEARDLYESALDAACVCVDVRVGSGLGFKVGWFGCGFTCGEGEDGAWATVEIGHALSFRRSSEEVLKWVTNRGGARGGGRRTAMPRTALARAASRKTRELPRTTVESIVVVVRCVNPARTFASEVATWRTGFPRTADRRRSFSSPVFGDLTILSYDFLCRTPACDCSAPVAKPVDLSSSRSSMKFRCKVSAAEQAARIEITLR